MGKVGRCIGKSGHWYQEERGTGHSLEVVSGEVG